MAGEVCLSSFLDFIFTKTINSGQQITAKRLKESISTKYFRDFSFFVFLQK